MVNSGLFDSTDGNRNGKARCGTQQVGDAALGSQSSNADDATAYNNKSEQSKSADGDLPSDAIEPTATHTEINSTQENEFSNDSVGLPLEKNDPLEEKPTRQTRKLLCLYCDRSFVSVNLRQKHVERVHSIKSTRRISARRQNQQLCTTPCSHCDKLNSIEHTLTDLFQHLIQEHSSKYYGCLSCEERFSNSVSLSEHNRNNHFTEITNLPLETNDNVEDALKGSITRSKLRNRAEENSSSEQSNLPNSNKKKKKKSKLKDLRTKKISIKTSKIAIKRSKRLQQQAKESDLNKKRKDKKLTNAKHETITNKPTDKSKTFTSVNPYPEFDSFYRVKKITDHSIDNLKISSLTFDDVFDKAFFNRIKCNIEENLLHHIDGKLFKNEESESRISNFEKITTLTQEIQNQNSDNYGCEISLNAITPAPALSLNSQFGEDFESQIEYGSKPSKKKPQIKNDEVHYKYFTRRKYQASILQQKENRDLSKLDMWTQMLVKGRQEKMLDKKKSAKELQEYISGEEYKSKIKREELNRILDRRGPFEDLKEEATKKAAFDKLNSSSENDISQEVFTDVREVLNDLLNRVFEAVKEDDLPLEESYKEIDQREIPAYLDLRRKTSSTQEEIDKSDKIALICSSQETENFELPTNTVRAKNELIELTGEWARSRMYICAACGGKFSNMKYLLDHKSLYHQNVWVQHYEFVGNQSELYRHLSIPSLGKVGYIEDTIPCKQQWKRSNARMCTKCGKQCNALGELHRHLLECGGDWTWMLARKKCKYRPIGAKTRRKRKVFTGFEPKNSSKTKKTEPTEKKTHKKPIDGPRQRPSDADTIQRMLANLPAKRLRRNVISLSDVVFKSKKNKKMNNTQTLPTAKVKRDRKSQTEKNKSNHRALRSFSKVLSSRILDINSSLMVKRKMKVLRSQRLTRNNVKDLTENSLLKEVPQLEEELQVSKKRKIPKKDLTFQEETKIPEHSTKSIAKRMLSSRLNLKNFFPVKKRNVRSMTKNPEKITQESENNDNEKSKYLENFENTKKNKRGGLKGFVRGLSLRKRNSKDNECSAEALEITKISPKKSKIEDSENNSEPKKRKLQQSFRKVINKVKKIKTEKFTNKPSTDSTESFLEQTLPLDSTPPSEKLTIITPAEIIKENIQEDHVPIVATSLTDSENPPIPETIFNLAEKEEKILQAKGELDFDHKTRTDIDTKTTEVCIDTTIKPKTVPLISPNIKGKIRKPSRGLNDCIAMLTSKLQQKDDKLSSSRESLFSTSSTTSIEPRPMPLTHSTFPAISKSPVMETALDLSKKSISTPDLTEKSVDETQTDNLATLWTSVDDIIQKVIEDNTTTDLKKIDNRSNLDNTIDFVVNSSLDWFENRQSIDEEKRLHYKKPRKKKHSDDLITNIIFGKDKLIIAPSSNTDEDDPLIARIKENELKKKSSENTQNVLVLPGLLVNPFLAAPFLPILQPQLLQPSFSTENQNLQTIQKETVNEDTLKHPEEDKIIENVAPKGRRGRKPKPAIEANNDDQMNIKEISNNEPETQALTSQATLNVENEPTILENKVITKPASDSEDEVPLSQIAKQEEKLEAIKETPLIQIISTKNDMVETLTTDSLKENIEGPKEPIIIDPKLPIATKKIRRKKRKKLLVKQKRQTNKLDALLETNTNLPNSSEDLSKSPQQTEEVPEMPTKISNSQRTRRKSKSSKKIDKMDDDLFKNFSLVINKKTKRIPPTSIVDDSVCDDINFFVKPLETSKESIESKNSDTTNSETILNDSVEEMDMELEDIPINSSIIIERDASLVKEVINVEQNTEVTNKEVEIFVGEPKMLNDDVESSKIALPTLANDEETLNNEEAEAEVINGPKDDRQEIIVLSAEPVEVTEVLKDSSIIENKESDVKDLKPSPKKRGRPPKKKNQINPDVINLSEEALINGFETPLKESTPKAGRPRRSKKVNKTINDIHSSELSVESKNNFVNLNESSETAELAEPVLELPVSESKVVNSIILNDPKESVDDIQIENTELDEINLKIVEIDKGNDNSVAALRLDVSSVEKWVEESTSNRSTKKTTKNKNNLKQSKILETDALIEGSTNEISNKDQEGCDLSKSSGNIKNFQEKRRRGRPPSKNKVSNIEMSDIESNSTKLEPECNEAVTEIFEEKISAINIFETSQNLDNSSTEKINVSDAQNTIPIASDPQNLLNPEILANQDNISNFIDEGSKSRRSRKVIDYNEDILEKRAIEINKLMKNQDKKGKRARKNVEENVENNDEQILEQVEINQEISVDSQIIEYLPTKVPWEEVIICNVTEFSEIPKLVVDIHHKDQIDHNDIVPESNLEKETDKNKEIALEEPTDTEKPKLNDALDVYNFNEMIVPKKLEKKKRKSRKSNEICQVVKENINDDKTSLVEDLVTLEQKLEALENESYSRYQRRSNKAVNYNEELLLNPAKMNFEKNCLEDEPQSLGENVDNINEPLSSREDLKVIESQILNSNESIDMLNGIESDEKMEVCVPEASRKDVFEFEESSINKDESLTVPTEAKIPMVNNNKFVEIELESELVLKRQRSKGKSKRNKKNQKSTNLDVTDCSEVNEEPASSELELESTQIQTSEVESNFVKDVFRFEEINQSSKANDVEAQMTDDKTLETDIFDNKETSTNEFEKKSDQTNSEIASETKSNSHDNEEDQNSSLVIMDEVLPAKDVFDLKESNIFEFTESPEVNDEIRAEKQNNDNEFISKQIPLDEFADVTECKRTRKPKKSNMDVDITNILDSAPRKRKSRNNVSSDFIMQDQDTQNKDLSNNLKEGTHKSLEPHFSSNINQSLPLTDGTDVLDVKSNNLIAPSASNTVEKLTSNENLLEDVVVESKSLPALTKNKRRKIEDTDHQNQLAKINIKDLLMSSLAPPDSSYEKVSKKIKTNKSKQEDIFDDIQENSSINSFAALKNVLNTFSNNKADVFSEIPPLSEIISNSEMDIAPVLDEIDKSLESEDIYDFNEDIDDNNINSKKSSKKKLKSKSAKKLEITKSKKKSKQELLTIEKEVADILNNKSNTEQNETLEQQKELDPEGLELRRSRRGSRKVASYNENDLIDPLVDALEKTRSRATRKDKSTEKPLIDKPKLSSEELFDLLKKSSCDNEVTTTIATVPVTDTTFFDDHSSNGADQDLPSDDVDSITDKTFIEPAKIQDPDKIYEFTEESLENAAEIFNNKKKKALLPETNENNYCEICKKSFIRIENLIKHKTTLTHISKLSELEAKEAEERARLEKLAKEERAKIDDNNINLTNILQPSEVCIQEEGPLPIQNNHSLKLVDIISDVLNKPVLESYEKKAQECDVRRYKSLGERKSFESEVNSSPYMLPTTILEKQINLLENIIGNNLNNKQEDNFIDEISSCSNNSNVSEIDRNSCTAIFNVNSDANFIKPPIQYEEISEDSANARVYEDPKQRKTLNRDEELFLECCSLLKSGSEVSNPIKNPQIEPFNEPELLQSKNLIQPVEEAREYSDNSRTPTPLGDTFDDEASNSNTISSNWHLNSEKTVDKNPSLSFEEVKNKEAAGMSFGEILTKGLKNQFENVAKVNERSKDSCQEDRTPEQSPPQDDSDSSTISKKIATKGARKVYEGLKVSIPTEDLNLDVLNTSPSYKKADLTKTPPILEDQIPSKPRSTRKSKPVKKSQVGSNLLFKVNKKKPMQNAIEKPDVYSFEETQDNADIFVKPPAIDSNKKNSTIMASDNESLGYADSIGADANSVSSVSSILSTKKPTPENITKKKCKIMGKIFKNAAKTKIDEIDADLRNIPEIPEIDNLELVENYVRSCQRVQSPFLPPAPPPSLEEVPKKPKMTEEEMNMLFDQLLGKEIKEEKITKPIKNNNKEPKKKNNNGKVKNSRKRARANSESSGDEFNINKTSKKRANKKNNQDDSGINLELELKECIGVASRKSQRTCTSGKQNILVEYWSSDEEAFEALLENHKVPIKTDENTDIFEKPLEKKPKKFIKKKPNNKKVNKTPQESLTTSNNRRKRAAANPLYHWSSSSEDESQSLIEIKPIREEDDEDDRPVQHGWIVGDSPKKLVTMLALTKGKKTDIDSVKEQRKRRTSNTAS